MGIGEACLNIFNLIYSFIRFEAIWIPGIFCSHSTLHAYKFTYTHTHICTAYPFRIYSNNNKFIKVII